MLDPQDPEREVILKTLKAGDFFGELPLFDPAPRNASVAAMEPCHLQVLTYRAFQKAIQGSPDRRRGSVVHYKIRVAALAINPTVNLVRILGQRSTHGALSGSAIGVSGRARNVAFVVQPFQQLLVGASGVLAHSVAASVFIRLQIVADAIARGVCFG